MPADPPDRGADGVAGQPGLVPWFIRGSAVFFRWVVAVQAVGGIVGIIVGAVTLHGIRVLVGLVQVMIAGVVLGVNSAAVGGEDVTEVSGPAGAFVIRTGRKRVWRDAHGLRRLTAFISGGSTWAAVVRRRSDDPFGAGVRIGTAANQWAALALSAETASRIRHGHDPTVAPG